MKNLVNLPTLFHFPLCLAINDYIQLQTHSHSPNCLLQKISAISTCDSFLQITVIPAKLHDTFVKITSTIVRLLRNSASIQPRTALPKFIQPDHLPTPPPMWNSNLFTCHSVPFHSWVGVVSLHFCPPYFVLGHLLFSAPMAQRRFSAMLLVSGRSTGSIVICAPPLGSISIRSCRCSSRARRSASRRATPGGSVRGERANFTRLVLGCIDADFCK